MKMKLTLCASLPLALLISSAQAQAKAAEVQLGCRTPLFAYPDDNPLAAIAAALGKNKGAARVRVSWSDTLGSGWDKGTMLYDRKRHLLKYHDVTGAGEEYHQRSYVFTGINDAALRSLVQKYNTRQTIRKLYPFTFLDTLRVLGYQRYKLADNKGGS